MIKKIFLIIILYNLIFLAIFFEVCIVKIGVKNIEKTFFMWIIFTCISSIAISETIYKLKIKIFFEQILLALMYAFIFILILQKFKISQEAFLNYFRKIDSSTLVNFSAYSLLIATSEELIFRKFLLNIFKKFTSSGFSIFFSALIFYMAHLHITILPAIFFTGILYAFIANRYDSLISVIIFHWIYDFFGFLSQEISKNEIIVAHVLSESQIIKAVNGITNLSFQIFYFGTIAIIFIVKNYSSKK